MNERLLHIRTLTIEELSGVISEEDKKLLYAAIEKDTEAKTEWEKTKAYFESPEMQKLYNEIDIEKSLEAVKSVKPVESYSATVPKQKKLSRLWLYTGAVAAMLIVVLTIDYIVSLSHRPQIKAVTVIVKKHIKLQLADGKTIDLSAQTGNVQAGEQQLNNTGKSLSFAGTVQASVAINSLEVPVGADYELHLQDATIVWLNSATKIDFPFTFTGNTREISINGEAYLQVAHNPQKPFIVHLPGGTVKVLGTEFNVNTYDSSAARVSLVKGHIVMRANKDSVSVLPGQQVVCNNSGISIQSFDTDDVLSWRRGIHYFYNADINSINTIIQRWFGVTVQIDNPESLKESFTGSLDKNRPLNDFLQNLKLSNNIDYYYESGIIHLKQKK